MRNSLSLINNYEAELRLLLTHVTDLDLSGCGLGDFHDLVYYVGKEMRSLLNLSLAENGLTNRGLRSLFGVDGDGCSNVTALNVRSNLGITPEGLKKYVLLSKTKALQQVSVSIQRDDFQLWLRSVVSKGCGWKLGRNRIEEETPIFSQGWATDLINDWILYGHHLNFFYLFL